MVSGKTNECINIRKHNLCSGFNLIMLISIKNKHQLGQKSNERYE